MTKKENIFKEKILAMRTDEKIKRRRWNPKDDEELIAYFFNGHGNFRYCCADTSNRSSSLALNSKIKTLSEENKEMLRISIWLVLRWC